MKLSQTLIKLANDPPPAAAPAPAQSWMQRGVGAVKRLGNAAYNAADRQAPAERDTFNAKTQKRVNVTTPAGYVQPGAWFPGFSKTDQPQDAASIPFGAKTAPADVDRTAIDKLPRFGSPADKATGAHGVKGQAGAHGDTHRPSGVNEEIMYNQKDQTGKLQPRQISTYAGRPATTETLQTDAGKGARPYTAPSVPFSEQQQQSQWGTDQVAASGRREIGRQNAATVAKSPKFE